MSRLVLRTPVVALVFNRLHCSYGCLRLTAASAWICARTAAVAAAPSSLQPPPRELAFLSPIPAEQEDMPFEKKWDSDQRDIMQDLLTPSHSAHTHTHTATGVRRKD